MRVTNLNVKVFSGSFDADGNGTTNDIDITEALTKYQWVGNVLLQFIVARTAGSSTTDAAIMVSLDGGTTYSTLTTISQVSGAAANEVKSITVPAGAKVKTDINLGTSTTSTITCYACGKVLGPVLNA